MKLIGYELRKALAGRFWLIALLLLLILDAVLFLEPWQSQMLAEGQRHRMQRPLRDFLAAADSQSYTAYIDEMVTQHGDDWQQGFSDIPEDDTQGRFLPTVSQELFTLSELATYQYIVYPETLERRAEIVDTARRLGGVALAEDDTYGVRLNIDIIRRYSVKPALLPALAMEENKGVFSAYGQRGWRRYLNFPWGDLFALLIALLIAARAFPMEGKSAQVLHTTPLGRRHTAAAKLTASALIALFVSLLFSGVNLAFAAWKYGLGGTDASVLSLMPLMLGPLNLTIGQTAAVFTLFRAFGAVCAALAAASLSFWLKGSLASYIGSAVFLGGAYGFHALFGQNPSLPMALRLLPDVTLWTRPEWMFKTYRVVNFLSHPVQWAWVCLGFWLLLSAGLYGIVLWCSERKIPVR